VDNTESNTGPYIRLTGLQFRSTKIECPHCPWAGTAGNLKVPDLAAFCETPSYACPACMKIIATHDGLNTDEVMEEMQKVQSILAQEFSLTGIDTNEAPTERHIDYSTVRSQIHFADGNDQPDKPVEKSDKATAMEIDERSDSVSTTKSSACLKNVTS
jgi:hypothetical protein